MILILRMQEVPHEVADSARVDVTTNHHMTKGDNLVFLEFSYAVFC